MNRDIQIQEGSDYVLKLELLGENNQPYEFSEEDELRLEFFDIKGSVTEDLQIDITDFQNPISKVISAEFLSLFPSDPVKYKLILSKEDLILTLLCGYIYRE